MENHRQQNKDSNTKVMISPVFLNGFERAKYRCKAETTPQVMSALPMLQVIPSAAQTPRKSTQSCTHQCISKYI